MKGSKIAVIAGLLLSTKIAFALSANEIADKAFGLPKPKTIHAEQVMKIYKDSDIAEKLFTVDMKKNSDTESKLLMNFTKPSPIKFLMHTKKGQEDDQWIKLSSGQVKRISSSSKNGSFVNSHFTYEDFGSREKENYKYELLGEEKVGGADCYKLNAVRTKGKDSYEKAVLYVRKSDFFIVKTDFYAKGKIFKTLENLDIKTVAGIITPYKMVVKMAEGNEKTEIIVKTIQYNSAIKDLLLVKESL